MQHWAGVCVGINVGGSMGVTSSGRPGGEVVGVDAVPWRRMSVASVFTLIHLAFLPASGKHSSLICFPVFH